MSPDPQYLLNLVKIQMPYGKYKGTLICDLPEYYLVWYHSKGFPEGKLGRIVANDVRDQAEWPGVFVKAFKGQLKKIIIPVK